MGAAQSTPEPQRPQRRSERVYTSLDEKFDAVRISTNDETPPAYSSSSSHVLDSSANVSAAQTQAYVKELLKDRKNQLGLSALSTNNIWRKERCQWWQWPQWLIILRRARL